MAKRRHGLNPAKVKADLEALEAQAPAELTQRGLRIRRRLSIVLMCLLTSVLLLASFPPFGAWYLAYVALVPWTLALAGSTHPRWALVWAWVAGAVFWTLAVYWLWWVLLLTWDAALGFAGMILVLSSYWLVGAVVIRAALRRDLPMWIVLPVVWVALEYARAFVLGGFPWFNLSMGQYGLTRLIQVSDVTGQYGVSFFVGMVNGMWVDLLASPLFRRRGQGLRLSRRFAAAVGACAAATVLLLAYGTYRLNESTQRPGPVMGVIQQSFPIWLDDPGAPAADILDAHLEATRATMTRAGCDLVVWPETMLPRGLNRELLELDVDKLSLEQLRSLLALWDTRAPQMGSGQLRCVFRFLITGMTVGELRHSDCLQYFNPSVAERLVGRPDSDFVAPGLRQHAEAVAAVSRLVGCPVLAGGASVHANPAPIFEGDAWLTYNSAMMFDRHWRHSQRYAKVQLVPFSEYVPFRTGWPWMHRVLRSFVPPVMDQLTPGDEFNLLTLRPRGSAPATAPARPDDQGPHWKLAVPICYEGTYPDICRWMVYQEGRKAADVIVNISNDGWFVWKWGPWRGQGSSEQAQHLSHYVFRAIENRVPVVRAVNTGISASIDPNGRLVAEVRQQSARAAIAGAMVLGGRAGEGEPPSLRKPGILVDSRVSLYSRGGDVFAMAVSLAATGLAAALAWKRRSKEGGVNVT